MDSTPAVTAATATQYWHPGAIGGSGVLLFVLLVASAITDLRERRILNSVVYPAIGGGLLINLIHSCCAAFATSRYLELSHLLLGGVGFPDSLLGGILCFGVMCLQFLVAGTGGGDVKLQAAIGVLLGWQTGLEVWLLTMLMSGAFAVVFLAVRAGRHNLTLIFVRLAGSPVAFHDNASESLQQALQQRLPLGPFFLSACSLVLLCPPLSGGRSCLAILLSIL